MNNWQLIYTISSFLKSGYKQLRFIKKFLLPIVQDCCSKSGYVFNEKEKQKITFYYPLFNEIVNCENYLQIKKRRLFSSEKKRLAIVSVMATLYDDLIDEEKLPEADLLTILENIINCKYNAHFTNPKVKMIFELNTVLHTFWKPTHQYHQALTKAIHWQIQSLQQLQTVLTYQETLLLNSQKCGCSSLLWASLLEEEFTEKEEAFIYQSGFVGQLTNDLFDVYKDYKDGINNFVHVAKSIQQVDETFTQACATLHQQIRATQSDIKGIEKTIFRMALMHAFAKVCIHHLQKTENELGTPIPWQLATRKQLITDMAFWKNRFLIFSYTKQLAKL